MSEEEKSGLRFDADWKEEARREKERLTEETADTGRPGQSQSMENVDPSFAGLVDVIAMQALVSMGGFAGPGGEQIPSNFGAAKHFIDMLQGLEEKTKGNLTNEEKSLLDNVLYEVRMRYVQSASGGMGGPAGSTAGPKPDQPK